MRPEAEARELLLAIATRIRRHAPNDGQTATAVPGLWLIRASDTALVQRGILRPCFCVVAQGEKLALAGADAELRYGPGEFLASSVDMPVVGRAVAASAAKPYLAALFELTPHDVLSVLTEAKVPTDATAPGAPAAFVGRCDGRLLDVVLRAVSSLDDEREASFLAPMLRKELIYRLVTGPSAFAVCQSALLARPDDGVGRAVDWLGRHFKEPLRIQQLAKLSKMSASSLQHKFKATVMMAPLQYQKRLRLEEARRLLLSGLADVTGAALDVGYESPSQFTREYRRLFGLPPLRDVQRARGAAGRPTAARRTT